MGCYLPMGLWLGYGLDSAFGTLPIFLIIFSMLGFAGGVRAMMKTANDIAAKQAKKADKI